MDLIFQVQYYSLQHQAFILPADTSTTGHHFHSGSSPFILLGTFLCSSPVAYWTPTNLVSSSFSVISFAFSYCSWGSQGKNAEVVCHSLLRWTTFCQKSPPWPSWVALHGLAHCFIELDKAVIHVISLVSFLWLWFSLSLPSDGWG